MWRTQNKYYNTKKIKIKDKFYDSKFEAAYGASLEARKRSGEIEAFDTHLRIPLVVNGYVVCDYYIDFAIYYPDNTVEYVETKGYATPVWKLKWKLFCALFEDKPEVKITLITQGKTYNPRMRKVKN